MAELRRSRQRMTEEGLIHGESQFPVSLTAIVAILLLVIGVLAIVSMSLNVGPFN
jgi:putative membrane protein